MNTDFTRTGELKNVASYPQWLQDVVKDCEEAKRKVVYHPLCKAMKDATLDIKGGEFFFKLSTKSLAKPGKVTFVFTNVGKVEHDFKIDGKVTKLIGPGKKATLVVTLKKGSFPYLCTVPGHAAAGMKGTFTVR